MSRRRDTRTPISLTRISPRRQRILQALARYRYLDSKHIFAFIGSDNTKARADLRALYDAGLIDRLPNNLFRRDRTKDPLVYEIRPEGSAYLAQCELTPHKATWLSPGAYSTPVHNLTVCLTLASFELAITNAGLRFIPWGEILLKAPKHSKPHRFTVGRDEKRHKDIEVIPDAICSVEYPDQFACFAFEIDLTNHGEKAYADKASHYQTLIFDGVYKKQLAMEQRLYVLTICTNRPHTEMVMGATTGRTSPFHFKTMPQYGSYEAAPAPALDILTGWQGKYPNLGDLHGYTETSRTARSA